MDEKIVADITKKIPLDSDSVDMVTSASVLEHLENLESAVVEVSRILKKGGYFISVLSSKFALFSVINQCLPSAISRKILFAMHPETKGICGFKAYYNNCYYKAMEKLLKKHDFKNIEFSFMYNQSTYFSFFLPFAILSCSWDYLMYKLNLKNFCSHIMFVAEKNN